MTASSWACSRMRMPGGGRRSSPACRARRSRKQGGGQAVHLSCGGGRMKCAGWLSRLQGTRWRRLGRTSWLGARAWWQRRCRAPAASTSSRIPWITATLS
jgi:hypothetical protein